MGTRDDIFSQTCIGGVFFFIAKHIITYIALLYLQHDTILNLLTTQYIIIIIVISNAFTVLQTSLTIHQENLFIILGITLLTYYTQ